MPSELSKEYRVEIKMTADPFAVDDSQPTILKKADLEKVFQQYGGRKTKSDDKEKDEKEE